MTIHWIDILIFILYLSGMLAVGLYFFNKNKSKEDYYVGGRQMTAGHIGLSVVATDVGGGFSIGLGGLGFMMGLSGSWMLFTGIIVAWISAVVLIPKIYPIGKQHHLLSFPESLKFFYDARVALVAGVISFVGYVGFTSSQILAGAKLASATFPSLSLDGAIMIMGIIAVIYTVMGGLKAVIYTDTIQWIILMVGLFLVGLPVGFYELGGWSGIQPYLPDHFLSLQNVGMIQIINWMFTIVPIWFIGMTLYQRIYACRDQRTAQRAWFIAGLFEWPVMAFLGVILGLFGRVAFEQGLFAGIGMSSTTEMDPELGLPLFLSHVLPVGVMGLLMSAYFSAIMSTADSCLMAASGNLITDIIGEIRQKLATSVRLSQLLTFAIGTIAIIIAMQMEQVLALMLHSYAVMVSGLLIPVVMMLLIKNPSSVAALTAMMIGGGTTLFLTLGTWVLPYGLDPIVFGLSVALVSYVVVQFIDRL